MAEATTSSTLLAILVSNQLTLNAGIITETNALIEIAPPPTPLFDQLTSYLSHQPAPTTGFHHYALGIGATALCLRWGTYLAVLLDATKPVDPRAAAGTISMISGDEMCRINIEASHNLASLFQLMHENEWTAYDLLLRAYEALPMPQKRVKQDWDTYTFLYELMLRATIFDREPHPEEAAQVLIYPYRTLANFIVLCTYRNGPIETIHAGTASICDGYSLDHRRFTKTQARDVIRFTTQRMSGILGAHPVWADTLPDFPNFPEMPAMPPWPDRVKALPLAAHYPRRWSYTESRSSIRLERE